MDSDWYAVSRKGWEIHGEFEKLWITRGGPKDAALFAAEPFGADITFFFTPGAARKFPALVTYYEAASCPAPDLRALVLLVGDQTIFEDSNLLL
jgi:hypothetical protein